MKLIQVLMEFVAIIIILTIWIQGYVAASCAEAGHYDQAIYHVLMAILFQLWLIYIENERKN